MSSDLGVDVDVLKREIKKTYAAVSAEPERDFIFPPGAPGQKTSTIQPNSRMCQTARSSRLQIGTH